MTLDIQQRLLEIVKSKIGGQTIGNALSDILSIGTDAAYRRNRGETPLTIHEVQKLCQHFSISFDDLVGLSETNVIFEYNPTHLYNFNFEGYFEGMLQALRTLQKCTNPSVMMTFNNIPVFQLMNFARLVRFRLYFWAKTYLMMEEYKDDLHEEVRVDQKIFDLGAEVLDRYVNIPTVECYDPEFMRGLIRQIQYYADARLFKDPSYALKLMDDVKNMADHVKAQAECGHKYKFRDKSGRMGAKINIYLNDTINSDNSFYYHSEEMEGIYLSHNQMNYLHTSDAVYVKETKTMLEKQFANSSLISNTNQKERNAFFHKLYKHIETVRHQIEIDIEG